MVTAGLHYWCHLSTFKNVNQTIFPRKILLTVNLKTSSTIKMMSMEDMPSPSPNEDSNSTQPDGGGTGGTGQQSAPPSRFSNFCKSCCCGSSDQGISRNKIEPVIFQPLNDIYLQLKPHRRLRVIHVNGQIGAMPTHSPYYLLASG